MRAKQAFRALATSLFSELPRLILIALFSFAAIDKLMHFAGFVTAVQSYRLLPENLGFAGAIFFIMAELAIALGLITKQWRRPACLAAVLLLTIFTVAYLLVSPEKVCGCWFTLTLSAGGTFHILQNLIFIGLAILTWIDGQPASSTTDASSVLSAQSI